MKQEKSLNTAHVLNMHQMLPKISIITPSYNQGRFLGECITSILNQNYPNLEYIIIDGGSTDESVAVIQAYQDRLAFWVSEPDAGQSDAINKGFRMATGDIVAWLNADDYYLPGALEIIAQAYLENPKASFYFGDGLRVDERGQTIKGFFPDGKVSFNQEALIFGLNYILQPATFINRSYLARSILQFAPTRPIRRSRKGRLINKLKTARLFFLNLMIMARHSPLLEGQSRINYLDPNLQYGMDTDLWIRLSRLAAPAPIAACLAVSREYGLTKTSTGSFQRIEELRRIAEKHSGVAMTPGVLCYYLHTLHQVVGERSDIFTSPFISDLEIFWMAAANLLAHYGASPEGFPLQPFVNQPALTTQGHPDIPADINSDSPVS